VECGYAVSKVGGLDLKDGRRRSGYPVPGSRRWVVGAKIKVPTHLRKQFQTNHHRSGLDSQQLYIPADVERY
jgi:hypothetical protein